jgi:hypothetical protein
MIDHTIDDHLCDFDNFTGRLRLARQAVGFWANSYVVTEHWSAPFP